jgi:hypothetical protein
MAVMVAIAPPIEMVAGDTTPVALTVATFVLEDLNVSPDGGRALLEPSL